MSEETIPSNIDAEQKLLGLCIENTNAFEEICNYVSEDTFYDRACKLLFKQMKQTVANGHPLDFPLLSGEATCDEVRELLSFLPTDCLDGHMSLAQHLATVHLKRTLFLLGLKLKKESSMNSTEDPADIMGMVIDEIKKIEEMTSSNSAIQSWNEGCTLLNEVIKGNMSGKKNYVPSGFRIIDDRCGGLHYGDLVIISAKTSRGKTSFALSIIANMLKYDTACAIFSLEMTTEQIMARIVSMESMVSARTVLYGVPTSEELKAIDNVFGRDYKLHFPTDREPEKIFSRIRQFAKKGIKVFVLDYLQELHNHDVRHVSEASFYEGVVKKLKSLSKELGVIIIALSQQSRSSEDPSSDNMKGSSGIEQSADITLIINRPDEGKPYKGIHANITTEGTAELILAKGRNIGTDKQIVGFDSSLTRFYDIDNPKSIPQRRRERPQ